MIMRPLKNYRTPPKPTPTFKLRKESLLQTKTTTLYTRTPRFNPFSHLVGLTRGTADISSDFFYYYPDDVFYSEEVNTTPCEIGPVLILHTRGVSCLPSRVFATMDLVNQ